MRRRGPLLIAGACAAALLSADLVAAQTAPPAPGEPAPPAATAPPATNELPPQESAPPAADTPASDAKPAAKPADAAHKDKIEAGDDDADQDKPDAATPDPGQRQIHGSAVVQALDKITAETMRFEIKAGQSVRWKGLVFTLRSCETSAPDEAVKDSMAYLLVRSEPRAQSEEASREIFRGWMFAASPALNPLHHPVYDAWLISCRA